MFVSMELPWKAESQVSYYCGRVCGQNHNLPGDATEPMVSEAWGGHIDDKERCDQCAPGGLLTLRATNEEGYGFPVDFGPLRVGYGVLWGGSKG